MKNTYKTFLSLILLCWTISGIYGQDAIPEREAILKAELGPNGLGIGYELPLGNGYLAEMNIAVGGGLYVNSVPDGREVVFTYYPGPSVQLNTGLRKYYNLNRRREKGRKLANNSGNYFGAKIKYSSRGLTSVNPENYLGPVPNTLNDVLVSEIHWGMQRNMGERFIFNLHLGFGYIQDFDSNLGAFSPTFGFKFGYKIF